MYLDLPDLITFIIISASYLQLLPDAGIHSFVTYSFIK